MISALAPADVLEGRERQFSILQWKSGKALRQCLGSNGAEVQAVTIGEDQNFLLRALVAEVQGSVPERGLLPEHVKNVKGALVMDSRGIYDAATRNLSSLHGLRDSRSGYELVLAVNQAYRVGTAFGWVNGLAQLADALTKAWCYEGPAPVLPATTSLATGARRQVHGGPKDQQAGDAEGA